MNEQDRRYLAAAADRIKRLLGARSATPLRAGALSPDLQAFAESFDNLLEHMEVLRRFTITLASGDLSYEAPPRNHLLDPLKQLQSNLRHLTWQTQQIAAGSLDQHVDYLGEFSVAFNQMIQGLREKRIAEEKVRHLSLHDALTGLFNRTYFNEELERLRSMRNYPNCFVIADLDGLKPVNDTYGHQVGDLLIQRAARVLEHGVRTEDVVARIGGDEFAVILYGTDFATAETIMARIRQAVDAYNQRNQTLPVSLSLGAGIANNHTELEDSLRRADHAMYQDKMQRKGKSRNKPREPKSARRL
ncbi:MAG: GGDEF domain-containing protein [Candidatus Competibacteraceae bacterium]|nr:GGDEF domain-containing protein [Candidatus Competibacteraceae bacterium]MBK7982332.1 GGDEF domain-containing protein [Candidatus Competibacteraceae bacterium]MBK8899118.1 GGDEF domain-containing protein [Candidatus Competibacteraceae bacterium]MBK8963158.1 GGDEF domain-containing protein [Candidatus Competibacteraceae bacterium]MBK9952120.1 GGDEF domain-containing protein [Candidatus Competibacteraceae bacterium]